MASQSGAAAGVSVGQQAFTLLRRLSIYGLLTAIPVGAYYYAVVDRQSQARTEQGLRALKRIQHEVDSRIARLDTLMRAPDDPDLVDEAAVSRGTAGPKVKRDAVQTVVQERFAQLDVRLLDVKSVCPDGDDPRWRGIDLTAATYVLTQDRSPNVIQGIRCKTGGSSKGPAKFLEMPASNLLDAPSALRHFERVELLESDGEVITSAVAPVDGDPERLAHLEVATTIEPLSLRPYLVQAVRDRERELRGADDKPDPKVEVLPNIGEPSVLEAIIAGQRYRIYLLPFSSEQQLRYLAAAPDAGLQRYKKLYIAGIERKSSLVDAGAALGVDGLWYLIAALLLTFVSWPLLRVLLLSEHEAASRPTLAATLISLLFVPSLMVTVLLCYSARGHALVNWNTRAASYATALEQTLTESIGGMLSLLDEIGPRYFVKPDAGSHFSILQCEGYKLKRPARETAGDTCTFSENPTYCHIAQQVQGKLDDRQVRDSLSIDSLFLTSAEGDIAARPHLTFGGCQPRVPSLSLANREYFRTLSRDYGWPLPPVTGTSRKDDRAAPADSLTGRAGKFSAQRLYSKADGSRTFVVAVPNLKKEADGQDRFDGMFGVVSTQRALSAAIRRPGLGFAIIDNLSGTVLFHVDDDSSLQENFYSETDNDAEIRSAVMAGRRRGIDGHYRGVDHHFEIQPVQGVPWSVVTWYDRAQVTAPVVAAALISVGELAAFILALSLLSGLMVVVCSGLAKLKCRRLQTWQWIWPQWRLRHHYRGIAIWLAALVVIEMALWTQLPDDQMLLLVTVALLSAAYLASGRLAPPSTEPGGDGKPPRLLGLRERWLSEDAPPSRATSTLEDFHAGYLSCVLFTLLAVGIVPAAALFRTALPLTQEAAARSGLMQAGRSYELRLSKINSDLRRMAAPALGAIGIYPESEQLALKVGSPGIQVKPVSATSESTDATAMRRCKAPDIGADDGRNGLLFDSMWARVAKLVPGQVEARLAAGEQGSASRFRRDPGSGELLYQHQGRFGAPVVIVYPDCLDSPSLRQLLKVGENGVETLIGNLLLTVLVIVIIWIIVRLVMRRVLGIEAPFSPPRASLGEHYDALRDRIDKIVCTGAEWWYLLRQADGLPPAADLVRQALDEAMPWRFVDLARPGLDWSVAGNSAPVLMMNFSTAILTPDTRRRTLALIEAQVGRSPPVLMLTALTPVWARLCQPDEFPDDKDLPDAEEAIRWRAIQTRFSVHNVADRSPQEILSRLPTMPATEVNGTEDVATDCPSRMIQRAIIEETIALIELLGWPLAGLENALQGKDGKRDLKDFEDLALQFVKPQMRREWAFCSIAERMVLFQMAHGHVPNPLNRTVLDDLLIRRLVVLAPEPRIASSTFRKFVLGAESPARYAEWTADSGGSAWSRIRAPFFILLTLLGAWFAYSFGDQFNALATLLGGLVAVLGSFGKVAGFVRGSGGDK